MLPPLAGRLRPATERLLELDESLLAAAGRFLASAEGFLTPAIESTATKNQASFKPVILCKS